MKHILRSISLILLPLTLLCSCSATSSESVVPSSIPEISNNSSEKNTVNKKCLVSIPDKKIQLYCNTIEGEYCTNLVLEYNGELFPISGKTLDNSMFPPMLQFFNKNNYVAIFLLEGEGSGFYIPQLHLIKLSSMSEVIYDNPVLFLEKNMSSTINSKGIVELSVLTEKYIFDTSNVENPSNLFSEIGYGENLNYFIQNDILYCDIALQVSPAVFLGYIRLEYSYDNNSYFISNATFEVYSDNKIAYKKLKN